jgi:alpha-beta hydrolase superfamily lysophospholipase
MSSSAGRLPVPGGPGSVSGAPNLPDGFTTTFTSRYIDTGELRQHVVTGGQGPPLLLVHGWPQTWYAWRLVMPALAQHYSVIAADQRGTGLSGKPAGGYDTATLASDLAALMDALAAWGSCLRVESGASAPRQPREYGDPQRSYPIYR